MPVRYEKTDHIVTLTLDRPEVLNAFDRQMHEELNAGFVRFRSDPDAFVAIVTGAGDKAFSSGQDIRELNEVDDSQDRADDLLPPLWETTFDTDLQGGLAVPKRVIAWFANEIPPEARVESSYGKEGAPQ